MRLRQETAFCGGCSDSPVFTLKAAASPSPADPNPQTGANDSAALAFALAFTALCAAGRAPKRRKE